MSYIHFSFVIAVSLWLMPMVIDAYGDSYDSSSYLVVPRQITIDEAMNTGRSMTFNNENAIISTNVTLPSNDTKSFTVNYVEITKQMTIDEVANMEKFTFASSTDNNSVLGVSNDVSVMSKQSISDSFSDPTSDKINAEFAKGKAAIAGDLKQLSSFSNLIPHLPGNVGKVLGNITALEQSLLSNLINYQKP